jgi:acyl-coenzyme A thioesterase PaaI-like protein
MTVCRIRNTGPARFWSNMSRPAGSGGNPAADFTIIAAIRLFPPADPDEFQNPSPGMNLWPPFLFAGISVRHIAEDFCAVDVELRERFYNRNYVGCHFGGSLFAMTDPFWMMMVMRNLDRSYTVWDKSAEIEFLRPGRGTVTARFRLTADLLDEIRANTVEDGSKYLRRFQVDITDAREQNVARVYKTLHIRRKPDTRPRIDGG